MEAYQVRFIHEYTELCDRYGKLLKLIRNADLSMLDFQLNCPLELLKEQADVMARYINILLERSRYENIELPHYNFSIMYGDEYGVY